MALAKLYALALLLVLTGCKTFEATAPEGFAAYDDNKPFRALSPDGVVYRVREVNDRTDATLDFWREALKKRMLDAGYSFLRDSDVKSVNDAGYVLEVTAPYGIRDYTYLMAVFKRDKRLVLVESSGEVSVFEKRHDAIIAAVEKLKIE